MSTALQKKPVPGPFDRKIVPPDMDYEYFAGIEQVPFRPEATKFDEVNLWWLAELSFLSYCHPQFIRLATHVAGMPRFRFFDGSVAECFIVGTPEYSIVFVRGTEVFSVNAFFDVIADLNVRQVEEPAGGKVHQGFKDALDEIWDGPEGLGAHLAALRREYGEKHRVWFTGHSLGAAIVTIAAARYREGAGLYTFGSPRVGNRAFTEAVRLPTIRCINSRDPVALLPPSIRLPGGLEIEYRHVGAIYRFSVRGELAQPEGDADSREQRPEDGFGDLLNLQSRFQRWVTESVPGTPTDHAPLYYVLRSWNYLCETRFAGAVDVNQPGRDNTRQGG